MLTDYGMASDTWNGHNFKVGDILSAPLHYTAQSPRFYIVTRTSPSSIWVKRLGAIVVKDDGYGQNGQKIADPSVVLGDEMMCRIKKSGYVTIADGTARIWDGRPVDYYTD